ncbi:MAG TPA: hypothetical protein VJL58_01190, partial [Pyrinomonadaceae bacterium]|nr:hypothetical protein [Pyrinomonadaceae bacterium]
YGGEAFREGLNHVIRRELEFGHIADKEINAAYGANRAMQNLYEMSVQDESDRSDLEKKFADAISQATTADDTHPSPADRFKYIETINSLETAPLHGIVWDLFNDRDAITSEMNSVIERLVRESAVS